MTTIKLFSSKISKYNRPAEYRVLKKIIEEEGFERSVFGCVVTGATGYVDVEFPDTYSLADINSFNYIISYGSEIKNRPSLYAFIDRVEISNFNPHENLCSYRFYFSIDYWAVALATSYYSGDFPTFIYDYIEGEVQRAHVNDIRIVGEDIRPDLSNTIFEAEEKVSDTYEYTYNLLNYWDNGKNSLFGGSCFIYINIVPTEWSVSGEIASLADYEYGVDGLNRRSIGMVAFAPIHVGSVRDYYVEDTTGRKFGADNIPIGLKPQELTDDRIISIIVSDIPPTEYVTSEIVDGKHVFIFHSDNTIGNTDLYIKKKKIGAIVPPVGEFLISSLYEPKHLNLAFLWGEIYDDNRYKYNPIWSRDTLSYDNQYPDGDISYNEYLEKCIIKLRSPVYQPQRLYHNGDYVVIRSDICYGDISVQLDYATGAIYANIPTEQANNAPTCVYKLGRDSKIAPYYTYDDIGNFKTVNSLGEQITSALGKGAVSYFAEKNPSRAISNLDEARAGTQSLNVAMNPANYLSVQGTTSFDFDSSMYQTSYVVNVPVNIDSIAKNLALYGYNTNLHPHDIMRKHRREKFNYIKIVDTKFSLPYLPSEAISYIEEMFNNGVWLWWNYDDNYGWYEQTNRPKIIFGGGGTPV